MNEQEELVINYRIVNGATVTFQQSTIIPMMMNTSPLLVSISLGVA